MDHGAHPRLRVAIIGGGPKGLFALERLLHHAHLADRRAPLDVDLFEPHPFPGAGPVYDPGQPEFLRMNFPAERLNVWHEASCAVPAAEQLSFCQWRRSDCDGAVEERYPARAAVGRYLADGLARMRDGVPPGFGLEVCQVSVRAAERRGTGWTVVATDGTEHDGYDEVLLAIGHCASTDAWQDGAWPHAARLIPAVFPVCQRLAAAQVPPAARVAMRGFALTFVDGALALTEGRGGGFAPAGHRDRLRYVPSRDDAGVILPFSRSGRPMLAKPEPALAAGIVGLEHICETADAQIRALPLDPDLRGDLLPVLAATAGASLLAANGQQRGGEPLLRAAASAARWLALACDGVVPGTSLGPAEEIECSLDVGAGRRAPDLGWALGHTWRSVYPAIVTRFSGEGLPQREWPSLRALAASMERVAFGPPAINARKLLALIAAGRVDLSCAKGALLVTRRQRTVLRGPSGERDVDIVVNAVLPAPGGRRSDTGLLEGLLADGHGRIAAGRRGLCVGADAGCIGLDGRPTAGLSAIGRPTEDSVIGNDTLSRTLHPHADLWAERVVRRAVSRRADVVAQRA